MTDSRLKIKPAEKKRGNWPIVILLAVTMALSLIFYLKNLDWGKFNLKLNFDWLKDLGGTETVRLEK
jgi:hypothetical protein